MIPKTIYYCWFGGRPIPARMKKYMKSWSRYMPDYDVVEINENNYNIHKNEYADKAYRAGKYAFVSDYARFDVLSRNGGVYFDTDVELLRSVQPIIEKGPYMGVQNSLRDCKRLEIASGLGMAMEPNMPVVLEILDEYSRSTFEFGDEVKTVIDYVTDVFERHGFSKVSGIQEAAGFHIYPMEYFSPTGFIRNGKSYITDETYSIHHNEASWMDKKSLIKRRIAESVYGLAGDKMYDRLLRVKNRMK